MKKINKKKPVSNIRNNTKHGKNQMDAPLTRATFQPIFEDIKDLIISTAKGTESVLRKEMDEKFNITWAAISEHSQQIKELKVSVGNIDTRLGSVETKVDQIDTRLGSVETKVDQLGTKIDDVRTELKEDMRQMERRLGDKIDGHSSRLDNHETRISALEQVP